VVACSAKPGKLIERLALMLFQAKTAPERTFQGP
jgi:hypothetical protein